MRMYNIDRIERMHDMEAQYTNIELTIFNQKIMNSW